MYNVIVDKQNTKYCKNNESTTIQINVEKNKTLYVSIYYQIRLLQS